MTKRITSLMLVLVMIMVSSVATYAQPSVKVEYMNRDIIINGERIENYQADVPYFVYNEIAYIPLTNENANILGINKSVKNGETFISKVAPTQKNYKEKWQKTNVTTMTASVSNAKITKTEKATEKKGVTITSEHTNGYPLLECYGYVYLPLTYGTLKLMGWDYYYDKYTGMYLSTDGKQKAESMHNSSRSSKNKKTAHYIMGVNKSYSEEKALDLVFLVNEKGRIYNVDPVLIMAMIQKESTFNSKANGNGARGLMQIMPATAKAYGISADQLYDPNVNIDFGVRYVSERLNSYGGDTMKGLSAYNQGPNAVSRGSFNRTYYSGVMKHYNNINAAIK